MARVDVEFGIDVDRAVSVFREAAAMWERGAGRSLFFDDATSGFPVRLVYDDRQRTSDERSRAQAELDEARDRITEEGDMLKRRSERHVLERQRRDELRRALLRRVEEHNDAVAAWNERGGAPDSVAERLTVAGRALVQEQNLLQEVSRALGAERRAIEQEVARLNRASADHARRTEVLAAEFPTVTMEAGEYREAVRREGARVVAVGREIRIYRFGNDNDLRLILAHELGHALGLGHSSTAGTVMSAEHDTSRGDVGDATADLQDADIEMLRATCPGLVDGTG